MFNPNFMSVEVALQYIDRARTVGEGNIGVRPQQIEGVLGEASFLSVPKTKFDNNGGEGHPRPAPM